jgi:hypothetical protein
VYDQFAKADSLLFPCDKDGQGFDAIYLDGLIEVCHGAPFVKSQRVPEFSKSLNKHPLTNHNAYNRP